MSNEDSSGYEPERSLEGELDHLCDQFEKAWRRGEQPRIEAYLEQVSAGQQESLLKELLLVEWELVRSQGTEPPVADYLARFPEQVELVRAAHGDLETVGHGPAVQETADFPGAGRALKIRCPHCHNPVEILDDQALVDITCPSCHSLFSLAPAGTSDARVGKTLGHFELLEQLGMGAFGAVWKARDTQLDRTVAVKIPRRTQLDAEDIEKFIREARAAAQLKHPNIVSVHEVGREGETVYIVSDYIAGLPLDRWLIGQQPTHREVVTLCRKIALAVHHAHEAGVIHRDLKPSNIMLDGAREPHVMDFGLAKREAGEITMTVEGQILGTPAYMSPEQAKGEGYNADRRSDVYSLGVILFELLTKQRPFLGKNQRLLLDQVIKNEPPSPRERDSRIPVDLETIILKCLEKEPDKRPPNALFLAEELDSFLDHKPIRLRPISRAERAWRWCKRNPVVAGLITTVILVICAGIVGTSLFAIAAVRQRDRALMQESLAKSNEDRAKTLAAAERKSKLAESEQRKRAEIQQQLAKQNEIRAIEQQSLASARLYAMQISTAQRELESGNSLQAQEHLDACRWDLRGWEHDYLAGLITPGNHAIGVEGPQHIELSHQLATQLANSCGPLAFSPDGKGLLASMKTDGEVRLWDLATSKELHRVRILGGGKVSSLHFGPDGKWFVAASTGWKLFSQAGTIMMFEKDSGKIIRTFKQKDGHDYVTCLAVSRDGRWMASASDHFVFLWNVRTGQEVRQFEVQVPNSDSFTIAGAIALSPDGKEIACNTLGGILIWNVETGAEFRYVPTHCSVTSLAFSGDGKRIITGGYHSAPESMEDVGTTNRRKRGDLIIWNATNGNEIQRMNGLGGTVTGVAFSQDGTRIICREEDGTIRFWEAASGQDLIVLKGNIPDSEIDQETQIAMQFGLPQAITNIALSPDGRSIASGGQNLQLIATPRKELTSRAVSPVCSVAINPTGEWIAVGTSDGMVRICNAITGESAFTIQAEGEIHGLTFSADNKRFGGGEYRSKTPSSSKIKVWDATTGSELLQLPFDPGMGTMVKGGFAFSSDGMWIASGELNGVIRVWDAINGEQRQTLTPQYRENQASIYAFSTVGHKIVSGSPLTSGLKVWDAESGREGLSLREARGPAAFSSDGRLIVSATFSDIPNDYTLSVWDAASGARVLRLEGHTALVRSLAFSPDGQRIVSTSEDQTLKVWDSTTGEEIITLKGHTKKVTSAVFSPDGSKVISGSEDRTMRVWDVTPGERMIASKEHMDSQNSEVLHVEQGNIDSLPATDTSKLLYGTSNNQPLTLKGHTDDVHCVAFSPDGKRIVSGSGSYHTSAELLIWDAARGVEVLSLNGHADEVRGVAFSPDGRWIASASWDKTVRVWDVATGNERLVLKGHTDVINCVSISSDGRRIATAAYDGTARIWDATSGKNLLTFERHTEDSVWRVAFSPDDKLIASQTLAAVKVWNASSGEESLTLRNPSRFAISCVAFSPDGRSIVSDSSDNESRGNLLKIWDILTGTEKLTIKDTGGVTSVIFSPDGQHIISASRDKTLKIWGATDGKLLLTLKGHTGEVYCLAISPDGKRVASGSKDKTLKVWNLDYEFKKAKTQVDSQFEGAPPEPDDTSE